LFYLTPQVKGVTVTEVPAFDMTVLPSFVEYIVSDEEEVDVLLA
jgi:hypothetical protein